ncbi:MAG TPA: hypothetical protein VK691_12310 [Solirubrobacteraceae bacterium]|nr:hypothetical protein [Solirubrobacteraceae bacterium]
MSSEQQPQSSAASAQGGPGGPTSQAQPSEDELRAAYEAELNRITSAEMIIQTTVSLINIAGRRLGLAPAGAGGDPSAAPGSERDLEQVRDAIDGAGALMPILERRMPGELAPLRDAIAQLQVAYAREAQSSTSPASASTSSASSSTSSTSRPPEAAKEPDEPTEADRQSGPGPAQSSGRLWVPGS